jgi:hypothetical protein
VHVWRSSWPVWIRGNYSSRFHLRDNEFDEESCDSSVSAIDTRTANGCRCRQTPCFYWPGQLSRRVCNNYATGCWSRYRGSFPGLPQQHPVQLWNPSILLTMGTRVSFPRLTFWNTWKWNCRSARKGELRSLFCWSRAGPGGFEAEYKQENSVLVG